MRKLRALLGLLGAAALQFTFAADPYPSRPIRFLVPGASGSSQDVLSRVVANKLSQQLNQQVIVDVRAGASGVIGIELGKAAAPDGYTIVAATSTLFASLPALKQHLSYDPDRDFAPLSRMAMVANVMTVNAGLGVETVADFVKLAKTKPGQLNYGSAGIGSTHHLTMEAMKSALHLDITHIPYRGTSQAVPALLGNHVQVLWASYPNLKAGVEGGRIRLLANNGLGRSPLLPELPPLADIIAGFDMVSVIGVYGRAGTPEAIVRKIAAEAGAIMNQPEMKSALAPLGMEPVGEGPGPFAKMIAQEINSITKVVQGVGLRAK